MIIYVIRFNTHTFHIFGTNRDETFNVDCVSSSIRKQTTRLTVLFVWLNSIFVMFKYYFAVDKQYVVVFKQYFVVLKQYFVVFKQYSCGI